MLRKLNWTMQMWILFFPRNLLSLAERMNTWVMLVGLIIGILTIIAKSYWALLGTSIALSTFPFTFPYAGDCIIICSLLVKEKDTGTLMESDHSDDRHVSRPRHLILGWEHGFTAGAGVDEWCHPCLETLCILDYYFRTVQPSSKTWVKVEV